MALESYPLFTVSCASGASSSEGLCAAVRPNTALQESTFWAVKNIVIIKPLNEVRRAVIKEILCNLGATIFT